MPDEQKQLSQAPDFPQKVAWIVGRLTADLSIDQPTAVAIVANLAHETGGFRFLAERSPRVAGSRGGYGWAQWTGSRRRDFETFAKRHALDVRTDAANYQFLIFELSGPEARALAATVAAPDLREKTVVFSQTFERPGVTAYASRLAYAAAITAVLNLEPLPRTTETTMTKKPLFYLGLFKVAVAAVAAAVTAGLLPADNTIVAMLLAIYATISGGGDMNASKKLD